MSFEDDLKELRRLVADREEYCIVNPVVSQSDFMLDLIDGLTVKKDIHSSLDQMHWKLDQ